MTDRELLELAAKAAGYSYWQSKHGYLNVQLPDGTSQSCCHGWSKFDASTGAPLPEPTLADALAELNWNPLNDDGDTMRLAVKLGLEVSCDGEDKVIVGWPDPFHPGSDPAKDCMFYSHVGEPKGPDPCAATRRAIVRAAAEIEKAKS